MMAKKKKQNGRLFVVITVLATAIFLPVAYMILMAWGERSGTEFSPDDFTMRRFDYCRLPFINWTHRGIEYHDLPNGSAETLIADDWIRASGRTPKRWHLVSENGNTFSAAANTSVDCDARFLTRYIDFTNSEGENYIMKWTEDHPEAAKVFWPLIAEMARDSLYLPIPEIMEFVLEYPEMDDLDRFTTELESRIADTWYEAGTSDQLLDKHQRAVSRFENAIRISGGHPQAEKAKVESLAAVGNGKVESP